MSRGSSLLCAAVVGISAATFGCKSDEDAGAAFIRRYCELYQPCCVAAGLPGDGKVCRDLFVGAMSKQSKYNATAGESCLSTVDERLQSAGLLRGRHRSARHVRASVRRHGRRVHPGRRLPGAVGGRRALRFRLRERHAGPEVPDPDARTAGGAPCVGTVRSA
jgi:hypothetical protein